MLDNSDRDLAEFLGRSDADTICALVALMDTMWSRDVDSLDGLIASGVPEPATP